MNEGLDGLEADDEPELHASRRICFSRRQKVPLGKFGVDEDFTFEEHNVTSALTALDNSMPNGYCNVALVMLYRYRGSACTAYPL